MTDTETVAGGPVIVVDRPTTVDVMEWMDVLFRHLDPAWQKALGPTYSEWIRQLGETEPCQR